MIDLHSHSTASDGSFSPTELIRQAIAAGLSALALTDHDTVDGIPEARTAAVLQGIRLIAGIEIEVAWGAPGVFHILGLGVDPTKPELVALIEIIQKSRQHRNTMILNRMADHGVKADPADIAKFSDGKIITRPHFADYLVSIGKAKDRQGAFEHFLTPGKPFFEPYPGIALETALNAIHAAGGVAAVAHPLSLYVSWTRLASLMAEWKALGMDAIESWHPSASWKDAQRLGKLAQDAGLKLSAGSDFHGDGRPDRILGRSLEERHKIDESFLSLLETP